MDKATEKNLPYGLDTTIIENKFEDFLKIREDNLKYNKNIPFNLDDVINYFVLQSSRASINMYGYFNIYLKDHPYEETKEYAHNFRDFYNKKILEFFKMKYDYFMSRKNDILIVNVEITPVNVDMKYINTVSESNTINLNQYKKLSPFLKKHNSKILNDIDITVVNGNCLYFLILVPEKGSKDYYYRYIKNIFINWDWFPWTFKEDPRESDFYTPLIEEVQKYWNNFSLFHTYEYLICSSSKESKNFIATQLYHHHKNNELISNYEENDHIHKLLKLEKLLNL